MTAQVKVEKKGMNENTHAYVQPNEKNKNVFSEKKEKGDKTPIWEISDSTKTASFSLFHQ